MARQVSVPEGSGQAASSFEVTSLPLLPTQPVDRVISTKKRSGASFARRNLFYNIISSLCPKILGEPLE